MKLFLPAATLVASALGCLPVRAADSYTVDPNHTHPSYEISHFGWSTQRGRFDQVTGKITLDRANKSGSVEISIAVASVSTGVPKLDEHLRSEDFFNAARFPAMTFRSGNIAFTGDQPAAVEGQLTLLGVTKPVTLTITAFQCAPNPFVKKEACGADATTTIKRSEFGMTKYVPGLGDEVRLLINVEAIKD
jgi:polyisoprenoid-binding protein YceI